MVVINYSKAIKGYERGEHRDGGNYSRGEYDVLELSSGGYGGASTIGKESSSGPYKTERFRGDYRLPEGRLGNLLAGIPTAK